MYKEKIFNIELCAKHKFNEQMAPKTAVLQKKLPCRLITRGYP